MIAQSTSFLLGSVFGFGGAIVAIASRYWPRPRTEPDMPAPDAPGPAVWLACHTPTCAHMTTPHDPTPIGALACRGRGTVTTPQEAHRA